MDAVNIRNIKKNYLGSSGIVEALGGISLSIDSGEFVAVMGASGSGKSTLMNILGCLDEQSEGEYFLFGEDVSLLSPKEIVKRRNEKIGFIFQSFNLIPTLSAQENVALPLLYRGVGRYEREKAALDALEAVSLLHRRHHLPCEMSGGQQQRTAVARAIASDPELILADEPTGNLDAGSCAEVMSVLKKMNENGKTIVLITHNAEVAAKADRVISISAGKIDE